MADLSPQSTSIQSIYGWHSEEKLFVNRRYQRKLVWTLEEKQKLIESILKKYPVPAILIAERESNPGSYEIIDGLQRLHAIVSFIEGAFPTIDGKKFDLQYFPTAKSRFDNGDFQQIDGNQFISQKDVTTILDYTLSISVMRNATDTEIDDVFDRINTYGHRLSDQERRQAGVQNEFAELVRDLACTLRGDESAISLPLHAMPSISIDLPKTKHGYSVQADEVFWVRQGILRSTDLRDSMDEQCIADIAASLVQGEIVERSKDALDEIYQRDSTSSERILSALEIYGSAKLSDEFKFCIEEILKVCTNDKLRDIIFSKKTTNPFPNVFTVIMIAIHELLVKDKKRIHNYDGVKNAITNLSDRIDTTRKATMSDERRKNIDTIKGLISSNFVDGDQSSIIYENHSVMDIESSIRRSEIELPNYELKQGIVRLSDRREIDEDLLIRIFQTACAIANNGENRTGKIILGVTDKESDADRVVELDRIEPRPIGKRLVVGINREAKILGKSIEQYNSMIRERIKTSKLSESLKVSILSSMDFNSFYGMGVIVIQIPSQKELSYYDEKVFYREGDTTILAESAKMIADVAKRF